MKYTNNNAQLLKEVLKRYKYQMQKAPKPVAVIAHNFFLKGFAKGGMQINGSVTKWEARKFNTDRATTTRQVLTKTGKLSDSIKQRHSTNNITIYTNSPYAAIHQAGGKINITPKMRKFFWAMYYKELGKISLTKKGKQRNNKANQRTNQIAQIWQSLALAKGPLNIPKRPIFYDSNDLAILIDKYFINRLNKI